MSIACSILNVNSIRPGVSRNSDNILYMKFTDWLQEELDKREWNKADLARHIGFGESSISHIFVGIRKPGMGMCKAIAKEFGLPARVVYEKAGLLPKDVTIDPVTEEVVYIISQLPPDKREEKLAELRAYIEWRRKTGNGKLSEDPRQTNA